MRLQLSLEGTLEALQSGGALASVAEQGCASLRDLVDGSFSAQVLAGRLGALPVVLSALRRHSAAPTVVQAGCCALAALLAAPQNKDAAAQLEAAPLLVQLLRRQAGGAACKGQAAALSALAAAAEHPDSAAQALSCDATEYVLAAMGSASAGPELTVAACRALRALCEDPSGARRAERGGALRARLSALSAGGDCAAGVEAALAAVSPLLLDRAAKKKLLSMGFAERCVALLRLHAADCAVQEAGWAALGNVVFRNLDGAEAAATAGGLPVAVAALQHHSAHVGMATTLCAALANLCAHAYNQDKCATLGAFEAVVATLNTHAADCGVVENGCAALGVPSARHRCSAG
jgi:hypothetical protein